MSLPSEDAFYMARAIQLAKNLIEEKQKEMNRIK